MGEPCPCVSPVPNFDDSPYLTHVAELLEAARQREGVSYVRLARWLGVSRSALSNQHHAHTWLPVPRLLHEALLLHLPPSNLLPDDPTSVPSQLMQEIAGLSPGMQADVLAWVRAFVRELQRRT